MSLGLYMTRRAGRLQRRADRLVAKVERREAPRPTSLGARGSLAARGGYVNPASKGTRWCPGASRRSTPSLGFARDWQTSDALRRENARPWLFESVDQKFATRRLRKRVREYYNGIFRCSRLARLASSKSRSRSIRRRVSSVIFPSRNSA